MYTHYDQLSSRYSSYPYTYAMYVYLIPSTYLNTQKVVDIGEGWFRWWMGAGQRVKSAHQSIDLYPNNISTINLSMKSFIYCQYLLPMLYKIYRNYNSPKLKHALKWLINMCMKELGSQGVVVSSGAAHTPMWKLLGFVMSEAHVDA
jgi:hypothetical protein